MQPTPREFDKLLVYVLADVALKRRAKGFELNYPDGYACGDAGGPSPLAPSESPPLL